MDRQILTRFDPDKKILQFYDKTSASARRPLVNHDASKFLYLAFEWMSDNPLLKAIIVLYPSISPDSEVTDIDWKKLIFHLSAWQDLGLKWSSITQFNFIKFKSVHYF